MPPVHRREAVLEVEEDSNDRLPRCHGGLADESGGEDALRRVAVREKARRRRQLRSLPNALVLGLEERGNDLRQTVRCSLEKRVLRTAVFL